MPPNKVTKPPNDVHVLFTMDCEPAATDVTAYALSMSSSGPADYEESERSIRGHVATLKTHGFPLTLFVHPEVAVAHRELLLELQDDGACLGLHLHPYKLKSTDYRYDLGAYTACEQRDILGKATEAWERALGQHPLYFRAGYFSASDATFGVLHELGFRGGSLSNPGRVLPEHCSVWAGAPAYPHRAHLGFRLIDGDSDFVEIPVSVDFQRPIHRGDAGEMGYEWPYIPSKTYDHAQVIADIVERIKSDSLARISHQVSSRECVGCARSRASRSAGDADVLVRRTANRGHRAREVLEMAQDTRSQQEAGEKRGLDVGVIVTDTHNDQDYTDPKHPASTNLGLILDTIESSCAEAGLRPAGATVSSLCDLH